MADCRIAFECVVRHEDSTLAGTISNDTGGRTRFGISEKSNPDLFPAILDCDRDTALEMAAQRFKEKYWFFDDVESQLVANKLADMVFNMGRSVAIKIAQRIAGVPADGFWGPVTAAAVNRMDPMNMLGYLRLGAEQYYRGLAEANPKKYAEFLDGWVARARS